MIQVITHGPDTKRRCAQPPKLLRHPHDSVRIQMGEEREAVAHASDAEIAERFERGCVKRMSRCDPDLGSYLLTPENIDCTAQFKVLLGISEAAEFTAWLDSDEPGITGRVKVLV